MAAHGVFAWFDHNVVMIGTTRQCRTEGSLNVGRACVPAIRGKYVKAGELFHFVSHALPDRA